MRVATLLLCCFAAVGCSRMAAGPAIPDGSAIAVPDASGQPAYSGYSVLYSFKGRSSGGQPDAGLIEFKGLLYGTTSSYRRGYSTVFSVSAFGKVRTLHQFREAFATARIRKPTSSRCAASCTARPRLAARTAAERSSRLRPPARHVVHSFGTGNEAD
jgi:hypothetical protein